jgi:uncharacterized protein (TIGR02231 family)
MKNTMTFGFLFFLVSFAFAEKKIVDSKVLDVTVYPIGAMINRTAKLNIPSGSHTVVLDNLTSSIDPNTIQIEGKGNFEILSVKFEFFYPYAKSKPKGIELIEDSLQMFRDQRYLLEAEDRAFNEEKQMILANQKISGANSNVSVEQLNAMSKFYRSRLNEISKEKLRNQNERIKVNATEKRLSGTLAGMNNYKHEQVGRVLVETSCKTTTSATFNFSYFTHLAGWNPKYNIKAKTGQESIDVDYHAMVYQNTGIDWKTIDLTLSTSRPTYNNQKPELHPWYLDFYTQKALSSQAQVSYGWTTDAAPINKPRMDEVDLDAAKGDNNYYYNKGEYKKIVKQKDASFVGAEVLMNALNTSYKIDQKYTVMSNNTNKQVFIKNIKIPALFNHYSVPSMEKESFLTASINNWDTYDLVPGNATLFYNNTYVGKSYIYSNTTDDTLQISLGRDQGVKLTREKVQDLCTHKKIGSNIKKTYAYEITAKNTNREEVTIVIYDRIPVSKRDAIEVTVGDMAGADFDKETGILKWTKTIPVGERITIRFNYEVKYPKDKRINL